MSETAQTFNTIGVIVGRDLVGDALMKLPFLRALRRAFPAATICWLTSQGTTAFGGPLREATHNLIDEVVEQPEWLVRRGAGVGIRLWGFGIQDSAIGGGETKKNHQISYSCSPNPESRLPTSPHFDLLIDTRNRWKEAVQARLIPHGVFLAQAMRYVFSDRRPRHFPFQPQPQHLVDRMLELVTLAAGYAPVSTGALPVRPDLIDKARTILPAGKTYVGLAPGAGNAVKIWPRYKFEKVAALQAAKGRVPVFILGPQELDWYEELVATIPNAIFPLQDYTAWGTAAMTVDHTLAIGELLNVAVANDSGVGHMLAAADCPLISLFGPTSADKLAPRVSRGQIIKAQDFGSDHMKAIRWETVDAAIDNFV